MGTPRPVFTLVARLVLSVSENLIRKLLLLRRELLVELAAVDQHRVRRFGLEILEVIREDQE
jgi:hypothetical protein